MNILIITWSILITLLILLWRKTGRGLSERTEQIDNAYNKLSMTHNWTQKEGIKPDTDIYEFENGLTATHDKTLNRLYVYKEDGFPAQKPIDTTSMTVQEFEETLLGIEKL